MKISVPKTVREIRLFLGSVQNLAKFINTLRRRPNRFEDYLKKQVKWNWGPEQQKAFEQLESDIASIGRLKHYDPDAEAVLSTDASRQGLGATLWQINEKGKRPVALASRYLNDAEKKLRGERIRVTGSQMGDRRLYCLLY